jgi:Uma2 family endonuclease
MPGNGDRSREETPMAAMPKPRLTGEEYLRLERQAEYRSEFVNGRIIAMAGASKEHNLISVNVSSSLHQQLRGGPCETYASEMRVKVDVTGRYTYPDVIVVCDEPQFEDAELDTLLNPTLLIEILSPSTESYDRGDKTRDYRQIPSLREYLLVAQDRPHVERYRRGERDEWILSEATGLDAAIPLSAIGCTLNLTDVYERVTFPRAGATSEGHPAAEEKTGPAR